VVPSDHYFCKKNHGTILFLINQEKIAWIVPTLGSQWETSEAGLLSD
jgi:hypothetical protein